VRKVRKICPVAPIGAKRSGEAETMDWIKRKPFAENQTWGCDRRGKTYRNEALLASPEALWGRKFVDRIVEAIREGE